MLWITWYAVDMTTQLDGWEATAPASKVDAPDAKVIEIHIRVSLGSRRVNPADLDKVASVLATTARARLEAVSPHPYVIEGLEVSTEYLYTFGRKTLTE